LFVAVQVGKAVGAALTAEPIAPEDRSGGVGGDPDRHGRREVSAPLRGTIGAARNRGITKPGITMPAASQHREENERENDGT
jgi:hypothetical protein